MGHPVFVRRADEAEDKAVAFVEKLGGFVDLLPGTYRANMYQTKITDAGLKELAGLKNLSTLYLTFTTVTDAGLKELAKLKNLTELHLGGTQVAACVSL